MGGGRFFEYGIESTILNLDRRSFYKRFFRQVAMTMLLDLGEYVLHLIGHNVRSDAFSGFDVGQLGVASATRTTDPVKVGCQPLPDKPGHSAVPPAIFSVVPVISQEVEKETHGLMLQAVKPNKINPIKAKCFICRLSLSSLSICPQDN